MRIACGHAARRVEQDVGAPRARPRPRPAAARSSTGSFWRVSTSTVGPSRRAIATRHASTVSAASAGRRTTRFGNGAQHREVLDRLVGRPVLAHADRIVGADVDHRQPHDRREPDRGLHVVGEDQEGAAERPEPAVGGDAVEARGHAVLAHAPVERAGPTTRARSCRPASASCRCCRRGRRSRPPGSAPRRRSPGARGPTPAGWRAVRPRASSAGSPRPIPRAARPRASAGTRAPASGCVGGVAPSSRSCHSASSAGAAVDRRSASAPSASSGTKNGGSSGQPMISLVRRTSSAPSGAPWASAVLRLVGAGSAM